MNLEDIVASEVSKSETDKISHGLNYLLCERKKKHKTKLINDENRL